MKIRLTSLQTAMRSAVKVTLLATAVASLGACSRYAVSINENTVYSPNQLFSAYKINDKALLACVQSTIAEKRLMRAEQLKTLLCPAGEITALNGLEKFSNIEHLGLDDNKVRDLETLSALIKLKQLRIKNNEVVDFSPLARLNDLLLVEASGNPSANCGSLRNFGDSTKLVLPEHCLAK